MIYLQKDLPGIWGRKTCKWISRNINTNKEDIKLSHSWKVPSPMSTWCAAKNLFLYYRKYLSEHICNKLLWEHIPWILFTQRTQVDWHTNAYQVVQSTRDSRLERCKPPVPSARHPHYAQLWKTSSAWLPSIFKISIHTAMDLPIASLVLLKGTIISNTSFFPC